MIPEFSRTLRAEQIPQTGTDITIEATQAETAALAKRLQIPAVTAVRCRYQLRPAPGGRIGASIHLEAEVSRICVLSLDEFPMKIADDAAIVFVPADVAMDDDDPEAADEIPFDHGILDLGETATEQLALALDPYPRKPGAELETSATPESETAFAALAHLRRSN